MILMYIVKISDTNIPNVNASRWHMMLLNVSISKAARKFNSTERPVLHLKHVTVIIGKGFGDLFVKYMYIMLMFLLDWKVTFCYHKYNQSFSCIDLRFV